MKFSFMIVCLALFCGVVRAEIKTGDVSYEQGGVSFKGFLAYDDAVTGKRPGVLVIPEWWGLTDYPKHRAEQLAKLGYVAFVADMYGEAKLTDDPKEAGAWATAAKSGTILRDRSGAALKILAGNPNVDPAKIAAIGYCFGGTTVLELARSGADVAGVVSFHGDLSSKMPASAGTVKAKVLVCHGADDAFIPPSQINAFEDEMRAAGVDWQFIAYSGAHHAFTNPDADRHHIPNIAYSASADARSWEAMKAFFSEIFK